MPNPTPYCPPILLRVYSPQGNVLKRVQRYTGREWNMELLDHFRFLTTHLHPNAGWVDVVLKGVVEYRIPSVAGILHTQVKDGQLFFVDAYLRDVMDCPAVWLKPVGARECKLHTRWDGENSKRNVTVGWNISVPESKEIQPADMATPVSQVSHLFGYTTLRMENGPLKEKLQDIRQQLDTVVLPHHGMLPDVLVDTYA